MRETPTWRIPIGVLGLCVGLALYGVLIAVYLAPLISGWNVLLQTPVYVAPGGLMVPVIRDAQDRNLWQLAAEISRLAQAARDGSATWAELSGSTITVTSLGPMGGVAATPVINRPEVAIIGPNRIVERPMFVRDKSGVERVEKRKLMNISMSCDHRVVDGWDAASFAQDLKKLVEAPALVLADWERGG